MVDALERGETVRACQTLPTPADRGALLGDARIDHLGVIGATGRAEHAGQTIPRHHPLPVARRPSDAVGSGQANGLADLNGGVAVQVDERIDVAITTDVTPILLSDRPQGVAGCGDVDTGSRRAER